LGTDGAGRDEFARTVAGARASLGAALLVFAFSTAIGVTVGVLAGLVGGVVDLVISRVVDLLLGLPSLVLALAVVGALGPGFSHLILAMVITGWAGLAKLARSYTVGTRTRPDVIAARMAGISTIRIAAGHLLPGVLAQALIAATLMLGDTILGLAGLSFLGLGVQPPVAEWGSMLNDSRTDLTIAPWLLIGPGIGIIAAVAAATLLSDALRDSSDPARQS
jgi:ABC-type dipeptide/oligopeptide/nickel transport system permease subunit